MRKNIPPKTVRTEMLAVQRAFAVGVIAAGGASHNSIAKLMGRNQSSILKLIRRTIERAAASRVDL